MKKTVLNGFAAIAGAALLAGCAFPRYTTIAVEYPKENAEDTMTLEEASRIVKTTLESTPAGRRPSHPGDRNLGKFATSIKLSRHNRTDLVLVEVKMGKRDLMEFYVPTQKDGEKFAAAVWRLRKEYSGK